MKIRNVTGDQDVKYRIELHFPGDKIRYEAIVNKDDLDIAINPYSEPRISHQYFIYCFPDVITGDSTPRRRIEDCYIDIKKADWVMVIQECVLL